MSAIEGASLQFAGGAGTVTGSKHWLRFGGRSLLLDCGLFQGLKALRLRNWAPPPFRAADVDAVLLSHAHIDHSGYLPLLVRNGFGGPIYCTSATADLLGILLRDSAHLQEEEAETANRWGYSKHHPARPLYTVKDAEAALAQVSVRGYGTRFDPVDGVATVFRRAGHILGSATVDVALDRRLRLVFSGDLGRWDRPILRDPEPVPEADVLLVESTYGDRVHGGDPDADLARIVHAAVDRGGPVVIPAFAVGRSQELLWRLRRLEDQQRIPILPVYLDSPMAIDVSEVYARHPEDHDVAPAPSPDALRCHRLRLLRTVEDSKSLNDRVEPMVIVAGSGMATGGRVLHHLERLLPDERTTVLLAGFQAAGTRGRSLQEGARALRMHGRDVPVRARVEMLDGLSAHADREEILRWLSGFTQPPRQTHVVHGEDAAAESLAFAIRERLGWRASVAQDGARVPLAP
jgi:metallo-beta-lactamase family protein